MIAEFNHRTGMHFAPRKTSKRHDPLELHVVTCCDLCQGGAQEPSLEEDESKH